MTADEERIETESELVGVDEGPAALPVAAFSEQRGQVTLKLLPQFTTGGTKWVIWAFAQGMQGPIQLGSRISEQQAQDLGVAADLRRKANEAAELANRELDLPPSLKRESREAFSFDDVEDVARQLGA